MAADKAIPAVIELGGKSAGIVYPDADLNDVIDSARHGFLELQDKSVQLCQDL